MKLSARTQIGCNEKYEKHGVKGWKRFELWASGVFDWEPLVYTRRKKPECLKLGVRGSWLHLGKSSAP